MTAWRRRERDRGSSRRVFHRVVGWNLMSALEGRSGTRGGLTPRGSWHAGPDRACQVAEEDGVGAGAGEGDAHPAGGLCDAGGDLEQPEPDGVELGLGEGMGLWDGVAHGEDQPVGGGVKDEPHLVGGRGPAAGAVGGELGLVQLDQVLGLAAGAVEVGIEPFGRAGRDVGDDVADVETEPRRFDAGRDAALPCPGFGGVGGLGEAAHGVLVLDRALDADVVGDFLDLGSERLRAGEAEDVIDAVRLAPVHDLGPAIVAVAADGDAGCRPMAADRPDETADVTAHLDAGGRLARPQDHGHRTTGYRIVDVDRQEAALVIVGIEERQLLVAVNHVDRVVDIEHDRLGRRGVAGAVEVDHHPAEPDEVAQGRCVLPARYGRLAHQVRPALRQSPAGELEGGVGPKTIEIVGILVAAGDGQDARE